MNPTRTPARDHLVGGEDGRPGDGVDGVGGEPLVARAPQHPHELGPALVELVVADGANVEVHPVGRLDGRLVVEVARYQRGGSDHVAGVHGDRAALLRAGGAAEVSPEPRGAAESRLWRLEVAVEIVHAEQLQLDGPGFRWRRGLVRPGIQAQQGYKESGRESGRSGRQVAAAESSHRTRNLCRICRAFVTALCRSSEAAVKHQKARNISTAVQAGRKPSRAYMCFGRPPSSAMIQVSCASLAAAIAARVRAVPSPAPRWSGLT